MIVLADAGQRVHEVTVQVKKNETWQPGIGIGSNTTSTSRAERVALRLPDRARMIDPEKTFTDRYPLDKAIARVSSAGSCSECTMSGRSKMVRAFTSYPRCAARPNI